MCKNIIASLLLVLIINFSLVAQDIRINEVVSSNSIHFDDDGDTPDWIELHNFGTTPVSLLNWGLTDDGSNLHDWQFPDITLNPDEYLLVWASGKDIKELSFARTLVNQGDIHRYLVPNTEPSSNWRDMGFDDTAWNSGPSGFGFGDGDDATITPADQTAIFTRITFTMADLANLTSLILDVDYDDAFVAYINGVDVARANISGTFPSYDSGTFRGSEAKMYNGGAPDRFIIDNPNSILVNGDNVLAIQVHNSSNTSSDMTLIPFLTAVFSNNTSLGINPPEVLEFPKNELHTNFKISSTSETLYLSDADQNVVNQILVEGLRQDTSYGVSATTNALVYYADTTPGAINSNNEFGNILSGDIIFSNEGGIISESSINLTLSGNTGGQEIRYTIDATEPTETSTLYTTPITISTNTVIRAQLFDANSISSFSQSKSYIFNSNHEIDVVFLSTDPDNFFDNDTGIYVYGDSFESKVPYHGANFWEDWERPIHFSFYNKDTKQIETEFNAGVKIFGGRSRIRDQRSLSIFARGQYGTSEIDYPFFDTVDYDKFQSFILRNSGNDWLGTSIKDAALTSLMAGSGLDFQAFRPVATYINDEYWGMYNLREKINEHFIASKHDIDADAINLLERDSQIKNGSNTEYIALIDYVSSTDLSNDANFEYVKDRVDLDNYAVYQASQIYFNNIDWPGNNIRFWNHPEGKWRWILYDTDLSFGLGNVNQNGMSHATGSGVINRFNPNWSTLLFRNLLKNRGFRNQFINRYADELNTRFMPQHVKDHIDSVFSMVESEINAHYTRWGANPANAQTNINRLKSFAERRPDIAKAHVKSEFSLPDYHELTITNTDISQGLVEVNNNLNIQENNWKGDYFETVPVSLTAIAEVGFEFSHWTGASTSTEATIELSLTGNATVTPNFIVSALNNIVINEINYKSGDLVDAGDWVELYNPNDVAIDVSNWIMKDDDDTHVFSFPSGTTIEAGSYLVLIKNEGDFNTAFPTITNYIGEFGFGFGGSDSVRLYDNNAVLQDEVNYDSDAPWPTCADGNGPTLELISASLDNNLAASWDCSTAFFGSPDARNSIVLSIDDLEPESFKIYPNPLGHSSNLFIKGNQINKVEIYTVLGEKLFDKDFNSKKNVELNLNKFNSGIYLLIINKKTTSKLVIK